MSRGIGKLVKIAIERVASQPFKWYLWRAGGTESLSFSKG